MQSRVTAVSSPALSAALIAGSCRERAQRVLDALSVQTAGSSMEVVVVDVAPAAVSPIVPQRAMAVTYLRRPGLSQWGRARAEAVRAARAPNVAFIEDHCYPSAQWAEALIEAHAGGRAAVGYAFTNANPDSWISRVALLARYGLFAHPVRSGPAAYISGNNVSYAKDVLLDLGDRLESYLDIDFNLHEALTRRGLGLFVEGRALAAHENYQTLAGECRAGRPYCRLLAARRAGMNGWGRPRRLVYGVLTPMAAPLLRLLRLARRLVRERSHWTTFVTGVPAIVVMYASDAVGESAGYLFGAGPAAGDVLTYELNTERRA